jgi:hypothetical protein
VLTVTRSARQDTSPQLAAVAPLYVDPAMVSMFMLANVGILVWFAQPSVVAIDRLDQRLASVRGQSTDAMSIIHIVKSPLQLPDDAARAGMLHVMKANNVTLIAMVVNESGFMLSMMRSVITGLRVLTAGRFDYRIDKSVNAVLDWFPKLHESKTGVAIDVRELGRLLRAADMLEP